MSLDEVLSRTDDDSFGRGSEDERSERSEFNETKGTIECALFKPRAIRLMPEVPEGLLKG